MPKGSPQWERERKPRRFARSSAAFVTCAVALSTAATTNAEPSVRVRAESRIEIGVEYGEGDLQVRGALRDELGAPIGAVDVVVTLRTPFGDGIERRKVTTDPRGRFRVERPAPQSEVVLQAAYAGDALHRGVRVERRIDQNRADVRLELQLPKRGHLDLDAPHLTVAVLAESDSGGHALPMTLRDENGTLLAQGRTDSLGRLVWNIDTSTLGPPGSGQLQLESRGDATRGEAQTEARIVRFRRVQLTLAGSSDHAEAGRETEVTGTLQTGAGPRIGEPVGIFVDGSHATTAITDERGSFRARLWPQREGTLKVMARAERDPVGAYTEATASIRLPVAPAGRLPWPWIALALLPCAALLALRMRKRLGAASATRVPNRAAVAGVQASPRTVRRATRTDVSGRVLHARTRAPLRGAQVCAVLDNQVAWTTTTDEAGRFRAQSCMRTVQLTVTAEGYAPLSTRVVCPHRGEWSDCQIRLESLRDHALAPFRQLVVPWLPSALTFNLWTPREIARATRTNFGEGIEELSHHVEHAAYAARAPDDHTVQDIRARASAIAGHESPRPRSVPPELGRPGSHR